MRKFIKSTILLLMVLVCRQGITEEKITWKVLPIDERAILFTDDYQIWLLHGLKPNKLSWNECIWREEVPQPDTSYFLNVKEWGGGKTISIVYSPWQYCEWKSIYRNDTSFLEDCNYTIKNVAYKTHVFAKPLQIEELNSLFRDFLHTIDSKRGGENLRSVEHLVCFWKAFANFINNVHIECKNKAEGQPYDEKYTEFNEKHCLCQCQLDK